MEIYSCSPELSSSTVGDFRCWWLASPAKVVRFLEANTELLVEVKREPVQKAEALGGERMLRMNTNLSFDFKKVCVFFLNMLLVQVNVTQHA